MNRIKINSDSPSSPIQEFDGGEVAHLGLTKREELAARAMQGLLSAGALQDNCTFEEIAETCTTQADALLAELEKDQ